MLAPILAGLFGTVLTQGRVAEALPGAQEMLDLAEVTGDADLLIAAHASACEGHFWPGELTKAVEHADNVLDRYDDETHRHFADILNQDPKTSAGIFASICTWMLGYPDRALRLNDGTHAHARRRERLGRENSLPLLEGMAPMSYGLALIQKGKSAEGIGPLKAGMAFWDASGGKNFTPTLKTFLAEALALTGDLDNALVLIDQVIAQVERPGWEERLRYAETLRLKGWMLSLKGDLDGAERNFLASLDWARRQQAKMWELRTSAWCMDTSSDSSTAYCVASGSLRTARSPPPCPGWVGSHAAPPRW